MKQQGSLRKRIRDCLFQGRKKGHIVNSTFTKVWKNPEILYDKSQPDRWIGIHDLVFLCVNL